MKKSTIVVILSVLVLVPMLLLTTSIRENKAEQQAISAVPAVKDGGDPRLGMGQVVSTPV